MPDKFQSTVAGPAIAGTDLPELGVGLIYSSALEPLLAEHPDVADVLEFEPQTTWLERPDRPGEYLVRPEVDDRLAALPYSKLVHSIGTPVGGSVRAAQAQFPLLRETVQKYGSPWASEHLAFNLTPDFFTGFFLPPRQTEQGLDIYAQAIQRLSIDLGVPVAFETGVNYLQPRADEIPDGQFVGALAERTGSGILLDLHNIYTNQKNGRQSAEEFFSQIPLDRVWEIHLAGGFELEGYWLDAHSGPMPEELIEISRSIIPHLPNLKAIIFEVFTSFLPSFGLDAVRGEMDKLRGLWSLRKPAAKVPPARADRDSYSITSTSINTTSTHPAESSSVETSVADWENALGSLSIGLDSQSPLANELRPDPGVRLLRGLIQEFRASMVVAVYRLSCRYLMLTLSPDVFRAILEDFWSQQPPRQFASSEAEAFFDYLRAKGLRLPHLAKLVEFEKAAMDTILDNQSRTVTFYSDPFPMLRSLAEGRLPDIIPQEGIFEIELGPDSVEDAQPLPLAYAIS